MNEGTQEPNVVDSLNMATTAPVSYGYCNWHHGYSEGIRLINVQEQGSGPGGVQFACAPCSQKYRLVPFADRP